MGGISKQSFLFLLISIITLFLLLFFLILPTISDIKTITADIETEAEKLTMKSSLGQNIDKNIQELNKIKKSNIISESFIPQGQDLAFIQELEGNAEKLGIDQLILPVEPAKNIKASDEKSIVINITLQGEYPSLLQYLSYLEQSKYYINIESLSLKTGSSSSITTRNTVTDNSNEQLRNEQLVMTIKATAYRK